MKKTLFCIMLVLVLVGCNPEAEEKIYKVKVGGKELCIPKAYFKHGDDPNSGSILLSLMRPEMTPISKDTIKEGGEDNYWKNKTTILLERKWSGLTEESLKNRIKNYTPKDKNKYGLIATQNNTKAKSWLFFLEPNQSIQNSEAYYIRCLVDGVKNPQCTHHFNHDSFSFSVNYSFKNIDCWKEIKKTSINFIETKKCNN